MRVGVLWSGRAPIRLTRGQGLTEVAGADSTQVEPRYQLLNALGLAQIRRQEPARVPKAVSILIDPLVVHAWLLHGNRTEPGLKFTFTRMAVTYDQAVAGGVAFVGLGGDVVDHLGFDRLARHLPGTVTKDLGQPISRRSLWNLKRTCRIVLHGAYPPLLGTGAVSITPRVRRLFSSLKSTTFGYISTMR